MTKSQKWKWALGFRGKYRVSRNGRVVSVERIVPRKGKNGCNSPLGVPRRELSRVYDEDTGYLIVNLWKGGKQHTRLVHRLVAEAFVSNPDNKPEVNHKDGNKLNNHWRNLEWVTHAEHGKHTADNNLTPYGENHGNSKLTNSNVIRIRKLLSKGLTPYEIRSLLKNKVGVHCIYKIKYGIRWSKVI